MCGIMDQYIVAMGQRPPRCSSDCARLENHDVPIQLGDVSVLICDTRVKHELSSSEYNLRRAECCAPRTFWRSPCRRAHAARRQRRRFRTARHRAARRGAQPLSPRRDENARTLSAADALAAEICTPWAS